MESRNVFNLQDFEQNEIPFKQRSFEDSIDTFFSLFATHLLLIRMNTFRHGFHILRILLSLDISKGAGYDTLPQKIIKLAAPIIVTPLTKIINLSKSVSKYPEMIKEACITPVFKKDDCLTKENYRPIGFLNTFSEVFECYILEQLTPFFNVTMSQFLSAYRKNFSCQNVLLRLIEQWGQHLDSNKIVGAVLMDLSKAFDCLPYDLLIAKLEAYGLDREMVKLVYSYLKD